MLTIDDGILELANDLRKKQAATNFEHLYAIAADGKIYEASGAHDHVLAPSDLEARYDEVGAEIVYHHSHPDDRALSPSDLGLIARAGVRTIWAHAPSGASYGARLRDGIDKRAYARTLESLGGHQDLEIVRGADVHLDATQFESFRDFAAMLALEDKGWIDAHLAWSDASRREIIGADAGFFALQGYFTRVTPNA